MDVIADLHLHSRFSRACSNKLNLTNLEKWARIKGIDLLGTADFTHPEWIKELKTLNDDGDGIYRTESKFPFILTTEISLIYSQDGRGRRIHNIVLAPNLEVVEQITDYLKKHGRVDYDGRPIFKIPSDEFVYELKKISKDIEIIPAHIWTPWFSLFGSKSGFNSIEEAFKDQTKHIHALETGISSDPQMNRRLSQLDKFNLVSFSDSHSFWPWRIGRESTIFDLNKLTYNNLLTALRGNGIKATIETDPSYGKYHFDGHRNCDVVLTPEESLKNNNICPKCNKELTLGVLHRVNELADRPVDFVKKNDVPYYTLLPLSEIIGTMLNKTLSSKTVWTEYNKLLRIYKNENAVLLNVPEEKLKEIVHPKIARAIILNRMGKIKVTPGYDGVYGDLVLEEIDLNEIEKPTAEQKDLSTFI